MSNKPYMVSQTIKYSDGSETVIRYKENADVELEALEGVEIVEKK